MKALVSINGQGQSSLVYLHGHEWRVGPHAGSAMPKPAHAWAHMGPQSQLHACDRAITTSLTKQMYTRLPMVHRVRYK